MSKKANEAFDKGIRLEKKARFEKAKATYEDILGHDTDVTPRALSESELSRNTLRKYGVHIVRHAMGSLGSLNFFSLEKFLEDCERERHSRTIFEAIPKDMGVMPMYFPGDDQALAGIREIAEKGNPKIADHTLKNVDSFRLWGDIISRAAKKNATTRSSTISSSIQSSQTCSESLIKLELSFPLIRKF